MLPSVPLAALGCAWLHLALPAVLATALPSRSLTARHCGRGTPVTATGVLWFVASVSLLAWMKWDSPSAVILMHPYASSCMFTYAPPSCIPMHPYPYSLMSCTSTRIRAHPHAPFPCAGGTTGRVPPPAQPSALRARARLPGRAGCGPGRRRRRRRVVTIGVVGGAGLRWPTRRSSC